MSAEELIEKGIVLNVHNGQADVEVFESGNEGCEECGARHVCKSKDGEKIVTVIDPFGVKPGDKVSFSVQGSTILQASFLLYGVPLIIIIVGIFAGMYLFSGQSHLELKSFVFAFFLMMIYFLFVYFYGKKEKNKLNYPVITSVQKTTEDVSF